MYGRLATECGYTPDQIRSMTLQDVDRIFKHWSRHPPSGIMLRAIGKALGIEYSAPTDKSQHMTAEAFKAFVDATDQGRLLGVAQG